MSEFLTIRNWGQFQHYSKRNPPWIKLHYEILNSEDWVILDDASRVLAIACMLLASRNNGRIPNNPAYLQRVAYLNSTPDFMPLLSCGFLIAPESGKEKNQKKTKTETETEEQADASMALALYPSLLAFFPDLCAKLQEVHPKTKKPTELDAKALADLARLDKYSEDDIMETLVWVLEAEHKDAEFWRKQFGSIAALRKRSENTGLTKFTAMYEKCQAAKTKERKAQGGWSDAKAVQIELEIAAEGGCTNV